MLRTKASWALLCALLSAGAAVQVTTPDGPIEGVAETTVTGKTYYAYYSIPYAKPPTGSRRFLATEPIDPWTEVHDGTVENPNICFQVYSDFDEENEDCLHLNVFTPQSPAAKSAASGSLPVMVNIHGGGFIAGSGQASSATGGQFVPKYLIDEDVIVVSLNYRLGVFGTVKKSFLSTGDEVIPGNAGLQDQILALKWVQKNIEAFGGDPSKVTVLGQSAGAASVGYLILSPAAAGLFAGAILESASVLAPWAYQRNQTKISFKTGSFVDEQFDTSTDSKKLLEVLQAADARTVDAASLSFCNYDSSQSDNYARAQLQQGFYYAPVIDASAKSPVISDNQYELLASGNINKVPILIGTCAEEGLLDYDEWFKYVVLNVDSNPTYLIPQDLHVQGESAWAEVGALIKNYYSPDGPFSDDIVKLITYFTHNQFVRSSTKHAELQSALTDVYFYQFSFSGELGGQADRRIPGSLNVTHTEEMNYIFLGWPVGGYPAEDQLVQQRMVKIWTNFAKYQNPTPTKEELLQNLEWPKVKPDRFQFVNIGSFSETDLVVVDGKPKAEAMAFWEAIYAKYGNKPFDSY